MKMLSHEILITFVLSDIFWSGSSLKAKFMIRISISNNGSQYTKCRLLLTSSARERKKNCVQVVREAKNKLKKSDIRLSSWLADEK